MRPFTRPGFLFFLVALWFAVLFWLSSQSHLQPPGPEFENKDKFLHTGYFSLGGGLFFLALRLRKPALGLLAATLITIAFCSAIGAFDEWHQTFTPNRSGNDPYDWMADTLGGLLGALGGSVALRFLPRRAPC
jgi:VanZ family protein